MSGHGMGVGDINGNGRMDVVTPRGWCEHPLKGSTQETWTYHAANFGVGVGKMGIYDVNGDGLNDVVTALNAHGWRLAWFEQKPDKEGAISFVEHSIMGDFSTKNAGDVTSYEVHGVTFGDRESVLTSPSWTSTMMTPWSWSHPRIAALSFSGTGCGHPGVV